MRTLIIVLTLGYLTPMAFSQNHFPETIPTSDLMVRIEDFATIPDSRSNQPPRLNVLTPDPSGRLFVNDQRGPLYAIDSNSDPTEFLDIRNFPQLSITSTSEAGFQSFAFHPDYLNEGTEGFGRLYTIHSSNNRTSPPDFDPGGSTSFHSLLLEWQTNEPDADTFIAANADQPYREILRLKQPFGNHNTGLIAFNYTVASNDADYGNLYVAVGDGGSGGDPQDNGQDPSNPFGAILRLDPLGNDGVNGEYGIVADNVLATDGTPSTLGEIYVYGLRNPQRFGWDTATGNMFIADIGQNAVEEIDLAENGANFGWNDREGSFRFNSNNTDGLTGPVAEYDHTNPVSDLPTGIGNRAVTVGEVARGTGIAGLDGQLLLADFPTGVIFTLDVDNDPLDGGQDGLRQLIPLDDGQQPIHLLDLINQARSDRGLGSTNRADLRFGINTPGEVYITNKHDGIVRRLVAVPSDIDGDFDGDGDWDVDDLDALTNDIVNGINNASFDLDESGDVDQVDLELWLRDGATVNGFGEPYRFGDSNLDGIVDAEDLNIIGINWQMSAQGWSSGDSTLDGFVRVDDLNQVGLNWQVSLPLAAASVPEPSASLIGLILGLVLLLANAQRRLDRVDTT